MASTGLVTGTGYGSAAQNHLHLVHGMGAEAVPPTWSPLTVAECASVLASYPELSQPQYGAPVILWHSPRPFSAAAIVEIGPRQVFLKRHSIAIRGHRDLMEEHGFIRHLQGNGIAVAPVLAAGNGDSVLSTPDWTYEVHAAATAQDLYRDAASWTPFMSPAHARSAGAMLARTHLAAADFAAPAREAWQLVARFDVVAAQDPMARLAAVVADRPMLGAALAQRDWQADIADAMLPWHRQLAPLLPELPSLWTHNDWHASNLLWSAGGPRAEVAAVMDFGLANRTTAVFDLATACERNTVAWLELGPDGSGSATTRLADLADFIQAYLSVRDLSAAERQAMPLLLPIVHVEFALAEVEYFDGILDSSAEAELAYRGFLLGHLRWFAGPEGQRYLNRVRTLLDVD